MKPLLPLLSVILIIFFLSINKPASAFVTQPPEATFSEDTVSQIHGAGTDELHLQEIDEGLTDASHPLQEGETDHESAQVQGEQHASSEQHATDEHGEGENEGSNMYPLLFIIARAIRNGLPVYSRSFPSSNGTRIKSPGFKRDTIPFFTSFPTKIRG